jgi:hypothetical protein
MADCRPTAASIVELQPGDALAIVESRIKSEPPWLRQPVSCDAPTLLAALRGGAGASSGRASVGRRWYGAVRRYLACWGYPMADGEMRIIGERFCTALE